VSHDVSQFSNSFEALQKLKEIYDLHSELELVQLIKLFSLELKNDDPLPLASKVRSIMHNIKTTGVKIDIPLIPYVKTLYPTYSKYLESLQASGTLKEITFDSLKNKFARRENNFWKKTTPHYLNKLCVLHIKRRIMHNILLEEDVVEEVDEE